MFIPAPAIKVGTRVVSVKPITTMSGTFTEGHQFTVTDIGERGYDLKDDQGHSIGEVGFTAVKPAGSHNPVMGVTYLRLKFFRDIERNQRIDLLTKYDAVPHYNNSTAIPEVIEREAFDEIITGARGHAFAADIDELTPPKL